MTVVFYESRDQFFDQIIDVDFFSILAISVWIKRLTDFMTIVVKSQLILNCKKLLLRLLYQVVRSHLTWQHITIIHITYSTLPTRATPLRSQPTVKYFEVNF